MAEFQPRFDKNTTRSFIDSYKNNPQSYSTSFAQSLENHANYHNIPFYVGEFTFRDAIADAGRGFYEGFTTLDAGDPSDNEYEAIFRSLGHLAGFAPGILSAPLGSLAKITKSSALLTAAQMARDLNKASVPMMGARLAEKGAKKLVGPFLKQARDAKNGAVKTAGEFLLKDKVRHITEGAFHLGAASAVSSWRGGVDQMMDAFIHGAFAGGAFRGIGNLNLGSTEAGNKIIKQVSGSLFMGLPSTMRGATTPQQIHDYLLGAWFGGKEMPWTQKRAVEFQKEYDKDARTNSELERLYEPEAHPKYESLPEEVKPVVKELFKKSWLAKQDRPAHIRYFGEELEKLGVKPEDIVRAAEAEGRDLTTAEKDAIKMMSPEAKTEPALQPPRVVEIQIPKGQKISPDIPPTSIEIGGVLYKFPKGVGRVDALLPKKAQRLLEIRGELQKIDGAYRNLGKQLEGLDSNSKEYKRIYKAQKSEYKRLEKLEKKLKAEEESLTESRYAEPAPKVEVNLETLNQGSTVEDNVGIPPITDAAVGNKVGNLISGFKGIFKNTQTTQDIVTETDLLSRKINKVIEENLTKKTGIATNESAVVAEKIKEILLNDYKYKIKNTPEDPEAVERFEGEIRQFLTRENNNEPYEVLTTDGTNFSFITAEKPKNKAGNVKLLNEPYKLVDRVYQELTGTSDRAETYLDHIVVRGKNGNKEIDLKRFRENESPDEYGGREAYNKLVSDVIKIMDKQGYHYSGGRGTADRLYFTKYHPKTNDVKMSELSKFFKSGHIIKLRNEFNKDFNFKLTDKMFDNHFKSNLLWNLSLNGMEYTPSNVKKILGEGFLKNATALNKRLSLFRTDSYPAEKEYFTNPDSPGYIKDLTPDGNFRIKITPDFHQDRSKKTQDKMKERAKYSDIKSNETEEHHDGGIVGRRDVVKALELERGLPESRTNKSHIISPHPERGALIGKYAIHEAGKAQSKEMTDLDYHLEIPASAIKQMGVRSYHTFYELDPSHIYQNLGIKQSLKFLTDQTVKKQMGTNLVEALAKTSVTKDGVTMDAVVEDFFKTLVEPRFVGTKEGNKSLEKYEEMLATASDKELIKELDKLDISQIGLGRLIESLGKKGNQLFVNKVYSQLLENRKRNLSEELEAGEINDLEYADNVAEIEMHNSVAERMIAASRADAIKRGKPENHALIYSHPNITNFRMKLLSSYIVNEATKPKIGNSVSAIIRPYDRGLQLDLDNVNPLLKKLNTDKSLVMLGDMHKGRVIDTGIQGLGKKTLGELWKMYEKGNFDKQPEIKKEVEEVFRAAVIRIPSDSISGTQILKFSGFTGRNDYGVLSHGLAMRAKGGADTDIDSAYLYFGGKGGFKKSWKDIIEANVDEFYEKQPDGRFKIAEAKSKEFEEKLIKKRSAVEKEVRDSAASLFAPNSLMQASEGSSVGRKSLGSAVNGKNIYASAYEAIVRKGSDTFKVEDKNGIEHEITLIPRTKPQEKSYINKLMKAQIAFSSDAMDYGIPTGTANWYRQALEAHFTIQSKTKNVIDKVGISAINRSGIIGALFNANSAYYGKNYTRDKQWTMEERRDLSEGVVNESGEYLRTMTPRIARLLHGIDYSDNILKKVDVGKLNALFTIHNKNRRKYNPLKNPLGRSWLGTITPEYVNRVLDKKYDLLNETVNNVEIVAKNKSLFDSFIKGLPYEMKLVKTQVGRNQFKWVRSKNIKAEYTLPERIKILNEIKEKAGIFASREMQTLVTIQEVSRLVDAIRKSQPETDVDALTTSAHKMTEYLKAKSYLLRSARNSQDGEVLSSTQKKVKTKGTSELDQNTIDQKIAEWKKGKTKLEKQLFDTLLLGSLNRGNKKRFDELSAKKDKRSNDENLEFNALKKETARTSSSMLGYNSKNLEPGSLERFLGEINDKFNEVSEQRAPEEIRKNTKRLIEESQKEENVEQGWPEESDANLVQKFYSKSGWEGVMDAKKVKLDPETKSYIDDVIMHLKTENNKLAKNIHLLVRHPKEDGGIIGKDINMLTKHDWFVLKSYLDDVKTGTLWQRIKQGNITDLSQRHYFQFPETVNRELMKDEILLMQKEGVFLTSEGKVLGKTAKPTQFMDRVQSDVTLNMDTALGMTDDLSLKRAKEYTYLDNIPENQALWEVAMATRELGMRNEILRGVDKLTPAEQRAKYFYAEQYTKLYDNITKVHNYEKLKDKIFNFTINDKKYSETGQQIVDRINKTETKYYKEQHKLMWGNAKTDIEGNLETLKDKNGKTLRDESGIPLYVHQDAIVKGIDGMTSGPKNSGYIRKTKEFPEGYYDPETKQNPVLDIPKLVNDLKGWVAKGNKFPMEFGVDGVNTIARSMMYDLALQGRIRKYMAAKMSKEKATKTALKDKDLQDMFKTYHNRTGKINFDSYFTHFHFDKKTALKGLEEYTKIIQMSGLSKAEQKKILKKLLYRYNSLTGDWNFQDIETWRGFDEVIEEIGAKKAQKDNIINWVSNIGKTKSQFSREGHIPGYSLDRQVPVTYGKSIINTYFRQWAQVMARDSIRQFEDSMVQRKVPKEQKEAWSNFIKLYVQGAIGNPDVVPEYIYNNPAMKIKGTPYGWWADNRVKNRLNKIGETLGIIKDNIPENLRGLDYNDLKHWSNLEARFELASLLAHPKSVVANIFGGQMHTIQSVGFTTWKNARNDRYMSTINSELGTKAGRDAMAVRHGIFPEQLMEEYALNPSLHSTKNKAFIENVAKKVMKNPNFSGDSIRDLAKKGEITKPIYEFAAKFMSVPERALRRDAFVAHYLYWYNRFGGALKSYEHPILIELAKKGVKATQFLYSAPYRPMFARTALGKVMTRFQLWGWNAVRFRKEALKQARLYGFKGEEAERAARIMQMDLFVFALGNAFTYSLFDTAMPSPYNWFQDTSEWIFGDEKERNRAFFGQWPRAIAPLQTITPPILRLPMASMRAILEDDWSRVSDYYIHTMYPFGRISRDFVGDNNLIDNPLSLVDKWTGIPLIGLSRMGKDD